MPKIIKSEALILKRIRKGETSLIVHSFTRSQGRVPFIAKGARTGGKRSQIPLIPVVLLELVWSPSTRSDLQNLRDVSLIDGFGAIHQDFDKLAWCQAALELISRTLTGEGDHETLFMEILDYFHAVADGLTLPENAFIRFQLRLLEILGFGIDFSREPDGNQPQYFRHEVPDPHSENSPASVSVHAGSWKLMNLLMDHSYLEGQRIRLSREAMREARQFIEATFRYAYGKWYPLKSLEMLRMMNSF